MNGTTEEQQYLDLIAKIMKEGSFAEGRNGTTQSLFGASMRFSLADNRMPLLTTKKVAWKTCLKELLWFIRGQTDESILADQNVKIWKLNCPENSSDLGPIYGHQWRFFNANYVDCHTDYTGQGVDQLQAIIDQLMDPNQRTSRRMVMSAWNPCQINDMALPPCHIVCQFHVTDGTKLSCALYQRSADMGLGVPFNIASYSFLTHLLAVHCGLVAHEFIHFIGDAHIYDDHIDVLKEQISRIPFEFPTVRLVHKHESINDYQVDDFRIDGYKCFDTLPMNMRP